MRPLGSEQSQQACGTPGVHVQQRQAASVKESYALPVQAQGVRIGMYSLCCESALSCCDEP